MIDSAEAGTLILIGVFVVIAVVVLLFSSLFVKSPIQPSVTDEHKRGLGGTAIIFLIVFVIFLWIILSPENVLTVP